MTNAKRVTINKFQFVMWVHTNGLWRGKLFCRVKRENGTKYTPTWNKKSEGALGKAILTFGVQKGIWTEEMLKDTKNVLVEMIEYHPITRDGNVSIMSENEAYDILSVRKDEILAVVETGEEGDDEFADEEEAEGDDELPPPPAAPAGEWTNKATKGRKKK
jgi:hypothetical protein